MTSRCLKLGLPEVAAIIGELHRKERVGWRKNRLLAVKLAAQGNMTSAEVAEVCGISRGHLFEWLKAVRTGGIEMLLSMGTRGRPKGWRKGVSTAVMEAFEAKLKAGEFVTMEQARQWLAEEHVIKTDYQRVWYWAKKLNGVLKVPRPSGGAMPALHQCGPDRRRTIALCSRSRCDQGCALDAKGNR